MEIEGGGRNSQEAKILSFCQSHHAAELLPCSHPWWGFPNLLLASRKPIQSPGRVRAMRNPSLCRSGELQGISGGGEDRRSAALGEQSTARPHPHRHCGKGSPSLRPGGASSALLAALNGKNIYPSLGASHMWDSSLHRNVTGLGWAGAASPRNAGQEGAKRENTELGETGRAGAQGQSHQSSTRRFGPCPGLVVSVFRKNPATEQSPCRAEDNFKCSNQRYPQALLFHIIF